MEKKDIKKVISSRKLIYIIAFLCVITMFNFNITSSRYMEEAFADNSRNRMAHLIIQKELVRCNSGIEIGNFRELVKGHLDSFVTEK